MRNSSAANSAASSPPVPARTSRIALRSSSSSRGSSAILTASSNSGSCSRRLCISSSASACISGSSPPPAISAAAASSSWARRSASIPSTIGDSSLYSFDSLAKSAPLSPEADSASRSSPWRRTSWSRRDSSAASISQLDNRGQGGNNGNRDRPHSQRQPHLQFLHRGSKFQSQLIDGAGELRLQERLCNHLVGDHLAVRLSERLGLGIGKAGGLEPLGVGQSVEGHAPGSSAKAASRRGNSASGTRVWVPLSRSRSVAAL